MAAQSILTLAGYGAITFTQPVTWYDLETERAMPIHRIPTEDDDIVQDMGRYSKTYRLEGLCTLQEKNSVHAFADQVQIDTNGKVTYYQSDDAGNVMENVSQLAIMDVRTRPVSGMPQRFTFSMRLVRTNQG